MLGERVEQIAKELGLDAGPLCRLIGFDTSISSVWKGREKAGQSFAHASMRKVADRLQRSEDWLDGRPGAEPWSPAVVTAWDRMREWARSLPEADSLTKAQRMTATWEQYRRLVPLDEDMWLLYLHWTAADWERCEHGMDPGGLQIDCAAVLTGIAAGWFWDGSRKYVDVLSESKRKRLEQLIVAENINPEELIKAWRKSKHPRE